MRLSAPDRLPAPSLVVALLFVGVLPLAGSPASGLEPEDTTSGPSALSVSLSLEDGSPSTPASATLPFGPQAVGTGGPVEVELAGWSGVDVVPQELITGPNPERYSRIRKGQSFEYVLRELPSSSSGRYDVEVYFAERASRCPGAATFQIFFSSDPDFPASSPLFTVDLCASGTLRGAVRAAKFSYLGVLLPWRALRLGLVAVEGNAVVSQVRVAPQGELETAPQVVPSDESRLDFRNHPSGSSLPPRPLDFSKVDVREAVLSRFGSRQTLVAAPQRLGFMYSALGIDAADLQELVVVVSAGGRRRALPLTDRYPIFERVRQSDSPTAIRFEGSDSSLGLTLSLELRAPFWPQDEATSLLPSHFLDLAVTNTTTSVLTPEITVAVPVLFDGRDSSYCPSCGPREVTPTPGVTGVGWSSVEAVGESSVPGAGEFSGSKAVRVEYGLVPIGGTLTEVAPAGAGGADATAGSGWLPTSPGSGIPKTGARIFRRAPRGHAGLVWKVGALAPGGNYESGAVLASSVVGDVASARLPSGPQGRYTFRYKEAFPDLTAVVAAALGTRELQISRSRRIDELLSGAESSDLGPSLANATAALRRLQALSFRSYVANSWWLSKTSGSSSLPGDFYAVSEGAASCCRFQSTVDVSYNDSHVLLALWPALLGKLLDIWPLYAYSGGTLPGRVVPQDIGLAQSFGGQVYIDMPVEENTNYTLLAYAHWKATGDSASAAARLAFIKEAMTYVEAADSDGDGLPDTGAANTIDAANPTLFRSPGQLYLGLKSASAARAASEMSRSLGDTDQAFRERMDRIQHRVLHTAETAAWRGDHLAVSLDPSEESAALRNYGSIYPGGTLVFNLLYGGDLPVSQSLRDRMLLDAAAVAGRTTGPYGSVHMEQGEISGWASQSIQRDMASLALGASDTSPFVSTLEGYRSWQEYLARAGDGGWWDTFTYSRTADGAFLPDLSSTSRGVLGYYPRGTVVFGYAQSFAGLTLDRHNRVLGVLPWARAGARVPLYALADWSTGTVPQAVVQPGTPPSLVVQSPTASSSSLTVVRREISGPQVGASADSFAPSLGETVQVSVGGTASRASLSAGHAGNWFYRAEAPAPFAYTWNGLVGGAPAADALGTACAVGAVPDPSSLQAPTCVELSVDTNTPRPSTDWYLAEGATAYGFETYLLVQNPGSVTAHLEVTYMTPEGPVSRPPLEVPPFSRRTIIVASDLPGREVSPRVRSDQPVVVERAMYWRTGDGRWREAHAVVGARTASRTWYLPEGSTNWGFDELILLQNPQSADTVVTLDLVAQDGQRETRTLELGAGKRLTVRVGDILPAADVAAEIRSTEPIVAERAMYWGGGSPASAGGSGSMGLVAPSHTWYFAEGSSDWGFQSWLLLSNPHDTQVAVDVVYMTSAGPRVRHGITMAPRSRQSISMASDIGLADSAIFVRASLPVLAERAMYYSTDGAPAGASRGGHASQGVSSPSKRWRLAEGSTAHGLHEFVLVQNPGSRVAQVRFDLQTEAGFWGSRTFTVAPGARLTVHLNDIIPTSDVSVAVEASDAVVVERAMYTRDDLGYLVMQGANGAK